MAIKHAVLTLGLVIFGSTANAQENFAGQYRIDCESVHEDVSFKTKCQSELASGVDASFRLFKDAGGLWQMKPAAKGAATESLKSVSANGFSCFEAQGFVICNVPKNVDSFPVGPGYVVRSKSGVIAVTFSGVFDLIKLGE